MVDETGTFLLEPNLLDSSIYIYIDAPRHEAHRRPPGALFTGIQGELDDESFVLRYQKVVLTLPVHYRREE